MNRARYILLLTVWCGIVVSCGRLSHNDVQTLYEQGRALREQGEPAEALAVFIQATKSNTPDEMLLGRIYSNMANICRQANEHALAYYVYGLSAEHFRASGDELAYAYALNNMAWEQAAQGKKDSALALIAEAVQVYPLYPLTEKVVETRATACMFAGEYDSVLYYTSLQGNDYLLSSPRLPGSEEYMTMLRAQAYSYLGKGDSATYYARELLPNTDDPAYLDDIYYILTHDDEYADTETLRTLSSERADVQKIIELRHGKLMQAVQLLGDSLTEHPSDWKLIVEAILIGLVCLVAAVMGLMTIIERKRMMRDWEQHERARQNELAQTLNTLSQATDLKDELHWQNYNAFCHQADRLFHGLATGLVEQGLNEQDIRLCVLVMIGLPHKQIAEMLPCSPKSIGKLKDLTARKLGVSGGHLREKLMTMNQ
ncbi:MAG: tetratricopeptide repeat protein [Paludibacteraceae bacterium]|nr:tetratricopeptide repeat protein [Paludibacteraceae bacterium]